MKNFLILGMAILVIFISGALPGCSSQNQQAQTLSSSASSYAAALERAKKNKRYFILHSGINVYSITSIEIDKAKEHMTVQLNKVDSLQLAYENNPGMPREKPKGEAPVLPKIVVYMKDSTSYTLDEPHTLPFDNVARVVRVD